MGGVGECLVWVSGWWWGELRTPTPTPTNKNGNLASKFPKCMVRVSVHPPASGVKQMKMNNVIIHLVNPRGRLFFLLVPEGAGTWPDVAQFKMVPNKPPAETLPQQTVRGFTT